MKKETVEKIKEITNHPGMGEGEKLFMIRNLMNEVDMMEESRHSSVGLAEIFDMNRASLLGTEVASGLMPTGYDSIDRLLGGFSAGEYVVVGGRPGMGKTMLLVNLALRMSEDHPVLYFSFDMNSYMLTCRFISTMTNIAVGRILQCRLTPDDRRAIADSEARLKNQRIYINEAYNHSIKALRLHCEKMVQEKGIRVIIIDYLQLMGSFRFRNQRELEMSYLSRELKCIALDLNVCLIVSSQLSRAVESRGGPKMPILSDLRDSGSIEQDADKVIFLYRPEYYCIKEWEDSSSTENEMELLVAKNRNGPQGSVRLRHNPEFTSLTEADNMEFNFCFKTTRMQELDDDIMSPF